MQSTLNLKIKFRESFRPFAPSVLAEDAREYFSLKCPSPYMLLVAEVEESIRLKSSRGSKSLEGFARLNERRSSIPAVTHVDYSARVQTVHEATNRLYHQLLVMFREETGCSVLVNTSFNVRGEPIVCTPKDAFLCFMGTGLEYMAIGNHILHKEDQDQAIVLDYRSLYALD
jgi:carbamoyltransferase|tara:strand:+ start:44 stop:559 length:516 start_codon:yes stop_codon:yes gene_type:complete